MSMGYRNIRMDCYLSLYHTRISKRSHLYQYILVENDIKVVDSNVDVFLAELIEIASYSEALGSSVSDQTNQTLHNRKVISLQ